jgi:hypothetical protein
MMGHREIKKGGDEWDVLTRARRVYKYTQRPGVCRAVKQKFNRRVRRDAKAAVVRELVA